MSHEMFEIAPMEPEPSSKDIQLEMMRSGMMRTPYPGYPEFYDRLVASPDALRTTEGELVINPGPWEVNTHANRVGMNEPPTPEETRKFQDMGLEIDFYGRPVHPWFEDMVGDTEIGVVTGKGAYWGWGPNKTVDPIVIQEGHILLIKRGDTGNWALPGGFIDGEELINVAGRRECQEETGLELPVTIQPEVIYQGPVTDTRTTVNAWPETTALLYRLPDGPLPFVRGADDAVQAAWFPLETAMEAQLFGSHQYLVQQAAERCVQELQEAETPMQ
jgi:ADP-ribose pyrophosphatase YjhB (NUDIX family)